MWTEPATHLHSLYKIVTAIHLWKEMQSAFPCGPRIMINHAFKISWLKPTQQANVLNLRMPTFDREEMISEEHSLYTQKKKKEKKKEG